MNKDDWDVRSKTYDHIQWVTNKSYMNKILEMAKIKQKHVVLDVGAGTGAVSKAIPAAKNIFAIDSSISMLKNIMWENISIINWDIREPLFSENIFDRIISRMCFHHITENIEEAFFQCYKILKPNGLFLVSEGIPPSNDNRIINWYENIFKEKEKRLTFKYGQLENYMNQSGFKNIKTYYHYIDFFDVNNWLKSSGIAIDKQKKIFDKHINADEDIKSIYNMKIINNNCYIRVKKVIITGYK